ncbi:MAG: serine/threonine protein kinase [Pirellulales bacterium]
MTEKKLGPYRIGKILGRGGMGTVYYGTDERTGDHAAIKVLPTGIATQGRMRERFEREIETLKQLKHPNIVRLYAYGEEQGELFYAMELVTGPNLAERIHDKQQFSWKEVIEFGIAISKGLKHAHDYGVIHRDIKPANLLFDSQEKPKIADFGIARLFGATSMTADGGIVGTADYMSPEQAFGEPVTPRSDLYSLGSVMYAMMTGAAPYHGDSIAEVLHRLRYSEPVPIERLSFDCPQEFSKLMDQLLEKDPQKRIPTATTLIRRLENILEETEASPASFELNVASDATQESNADYQLKQSKKSAANEFETIEQQENVTPNDATIEVDAGNHEEHSSDSGEDRFVTLAEDRSKSKSHFDEVAPDSYWAARFQTIGLIIALGIIVGLIFWLPQTQSADSLFETIMVSVEAGQPDEAKREITEFLELYPADEHAPEIEALQAELELAQQERRYRISASLRLKDKTMEPAELAFIEALNLTKDSPELAAIKLRALLDFYGPGNSQTEKVSQCLILAQRRLDQLNTDITTSSKSQMVKIQQRLDFAETLEQTKPEESIRIYTALTELYKNKPWAANTVNEAKARIEKLRAIPSDTD